MTDFKCLATGSSGNCYLLKMGSSTIVLDAGCEWNKLTSNVNLNDVDLAYISHEHKDHSKNYEKLVLRGVKCLDGINTQEITKNEINAKIRGKLRVLRVPIKHGACNNCALVVKSEEDIVLYATDFNICEYDLSKFKFTRIIVECNYLEENIPDGEVDIKVKRQINTHMGLEGLKLFLNTLDLSKCEEIDLIHISQGLGNSIIMGSSIYCQYKIKTGVCRQYGGIDYYG